MKTMKPAWVEGRGKAGSIKGEREEGDKQGQGTSWVSMQVQAQSGRAEPSIRLHGRPEG